MGDYTLGSEAGRDVDSYHIYFSDMSEEAQQEVLEFKNLSTPDDSWYLETLQHCVEPKSEMEQDDIDYAGKVSFGMHRNIA